LGETPGTSVVNMLAAIPAAEPSGGVDAHVATGLARPEVFNWPAHLVDVVNTQDPGALVLSLGSNDNQAMTGEGATGAAFGSNEWRAEYARRVGGLMDAVATDGRVLFWLGVPIVRQENKLESYRFINAIVEEQAALRTGRVVYVDTYDLLSGPDGAYADYLPNDGGELVEARAPDGTHYTRFGGDRIAASVVAAMNATFTLRPTAPTTTTRARPTDEPSTTKKEK
jgi:hypothetical protein